MSLAYKLFKRSGLAPEEVKAPVWGSGIVIREPLFASAGVRARNLRLASGSYVATLEVLFEYSVRVSPLR